MIQCQHDVIPLVYKIFILAENFIDLLVYLIVLFSSLNRTAFQFLIMHIHTLEHLYWYWVYKEHTNSLVCIVWTILLIIYSEHHIYYILHQIIKFPINLYTWQLYLSLIKILRDSIRLYSILIAISYSRFLRVQFHFLYFILTPGTLIKA